MILGCKRDDFSARSKYKLTAEKSHMSEIVLKWTYTKFYFYANS